jgi:hypothetical protein
MRGRTYLGSREENGTWINTFEANRFIHENLSPIDEFDPARGKKIEPIFQRTFQTSQTSFEIARYFSN